MEWSFSFLANETTGTPNPWVVVVANSFQALGFALLTPFSLSLSIHIWPQTREKQQRQKQGINVSSTFCESNGTMNTSHLLKEIDQLNKVVKKK